MNYTLWSFDLFCLKKNKLSFIAPYVLLIGNHSLIYKKNYCALLHGCPKWEIHMIKDLVKVQWHEQLTQLYDNALWNSFSLPVTATVVLKSEQLMRPYQYGTHQCFLRERRAHRKTHEVASELTPRVPHTDKEHKPYTPQDL